MKIKKRGVAPYTIMSSGLEVDGKPGHPAVRDTFLEAFETLFDFNKWWTRHWRAMCN